MFARKNKLTFAMLPTVICASALCAWAVVAPVAPDSVAVSVPSQTAVVTLKAPAPAGGQTVALSSSNPAALSVPASVTVPAGATSATVPVFGQACTATPVKVTASTGAGSTDAPVSSNPHCVPD